MNRREFCVGAMALGGAGLWPARSLRAAQVSPSIDDFHVELANVLDHPFYAWPQTLLRYSISASSVEAFRGRQLAETTSGKAVPFQVVDSGEQLEVVFLADLPAGETKRFKFVTGHNAAPERGITEQRDSRSIVLDSGRMQVRIPATQDVAGVAPGPIMQMSRGGGWFGSSSLSLPGERVTRIESRAIIRGQLLTAYQVTYSTSRGIFYSAQVHCIAGCDFVRLVEEMEGVPEDLRGSFEFRWTGCHFTHRQAPNSPLCTPAAGYSSFFPAEVEPGHRYEDYPWEKIGDRSMSTHIGMLTAMDEDGEWAVTVGIYQPWPAFTVVTSANFWDERTGDAAGIFIDRPEQWNDHEYAIWHSSPKLAVRFQYQEGMLTWKWPVVKGSRSTCVTFYDHGKDIEQMKLIEELSRGISWSDGNVYRTALFPASHLLYLQNMYGTLDLNVVKDWLLTYPENGRIPPVLFKNSSFNSADEVDNKLAADGYTNELVLSGVRQNNGFGPSRQIVDDWTASVNRYYAAMNERQRKRVAAICLLMAYIHADEAFMPMVQMFSGHPNFLATVKFALCGISFLFPDHPQAALWSGEWDRYLELNTRYHVRPRVEEWESNGGRWTENLGTYVWAFIQPTVRGGYLLQMLDGQQHLTSPQFSLLAEWLVNALSAPFAGETPQTMIALHAMHDMHKWGIVPPGSKPRRVYPPIGAHSERRMPPRELWYLGSSLRNYAPLAAEYLMWAARPTDDAMELPGKLDNPWQVMYEQPDNRGTNPRLRSSKYTGYGIVLRAAVDTPEEISVHLQQIDDGPNYRWGVAAEGGCGVVYFFGNGKAYSHNGPEDQGDRSTQDTDFCTNFGIWRPMKSLLADQSALAQKMFVHHDGQASGEFRAIGQNVLSQPVFDLGVAQFAELLPRQGAEAYSWPEYVSRGALLAGKEYFLLYDRLFNSVITHRFSWFVRKGDAFPTLVPLRGQTGNPVLGKGATQYTEIKTAVTDGRWYDGSGDSLMLVSHRSDLVSEATSFGCRVRAEGIEDTVICSAERVVLEEGGVHFSGTIGLIRRGASTTEVALIRGEKIGFASFAIEVLEGTVGIAATVDQEGDVRGRFHAIGPASFAMSMEGSGAGGNLYVDGAKGNMVREGSGVRIRCEPGEHVWEWSGGLGTPMTPEIERTEYLPGAVRVIAGAVAGASRYGLRWSEDGGDTWKESGLSSSSPVLVLRHPQAGEKYHVRVYAKNAERSSACGAEYPIYPTEEAPAPPDGVQVQKSSQGLLVSWGEVLGVTGYRVYVSQAEEAKPQAVYSGLKRNCTVALPEGKAVFVSVAAISGLGEGKASKPRRFPDPFFFAANETADHRFRRSITASSDTPHPNDSLSRYYPL